MTASPDLTPAHRLLAAALALTRPKEREAAIIAWHDLALGAEGMAADGHTDLTFLLTHASPRDEPWILAWLKERPEWAWQPAHRGMLPLELALLNGFSGVAQALLADPAAPPPATLARYRVVTSFAPTLQHATLPHALARLANLPLLHTWIAEVGPLPPSVWDDAAPRLTDDLHRLGVAVPASTVDAWRRRHRQDHTDVGDHELQGLLKTVPDTGSVDGAVKDFMALFTHPRGNLDRTMGEVLARIPNPAQQTVRRIGPQGGSHVEWSLLGWAIWQTLTRHAESPHSYATSGLREALKQHWTTLAGPGAVPDLVAGVPIWPLMALMRPQLPLVAQDVILAQSGQSELDLLNQAFPLSIALIQEGKTQRGAWLRNLWVHQWLEQVQAHSDGPASAQDALFLRAMLDPVLGMAFAQAPNTGRWMAASLDSGHRTGWTLAQPFRAWWETQPDGLAVMAILGARPSAPECHWYEVLQEEFLRRWRLGHALAGSPALIRQAHAALDQWAPGLVRAREREQQLAQRPASDAPRRPRSRA